VENAVYEEPTALTQPGDSVGPPRRTRMQMQAIRQPAQAESQKAAESELAIKAKQAWISVSPIQNGISDDLCGDHAVDDSVAAKP
jgi:hypothetical protein